MEKSNIIKEEEFFHDQWARTININDLCILEAFEGPVSPEYNFAAKQLGEVRDKKLLNLGCGAGEEAIYFAKKGATVWAIDISSQMLKVAKKLATRFGLTKGITFKKDNAEDLSFPENYFDLIFGNSVLHHVNIEKAAKETYRVLKKGGKAVFIEPLIYNPLINYYRKIAHCVRTPREHPLKFSDIDIFQRYFRTIEHHEFQFITLSIFIYFFLVERTHPDKDRYWKKIIREGKKYASMFKILFAIDKVLLKIFPPLRRFCWVTVIEAIK